MITPLLKTTLEPLPASPVIMQVSLVGGGFFMSGAVFPGAAVDEQRIRSGSTHRPRSLVIFWIGHRRGERWHPDYRALARQIEERHPELHACC
jgi:hypothetical protein